MKFTQTATYWKENGVDRFNQKSFDAPIEIIVRWESTSEKIINDVGEEVLAKSIVYTQQDLGLNDYLLNGSSVVADPVSLSGANRILMEKKIPNLRGTKFVRSYFL